MAKYLILLTISSLMFWSCNNNEQRGFTAIVEGTTVQVPALTGGKLTQIFVNTGDKIDAGKAIAMVDTVELALQREQLSAGLEELSVQVSVARTQLNQAKQNESYVQEKQSRIAKLVSNSAAPQQTLDDLTIQLRNAQSTRETAEQSFRVLDAKRKQLEAQLGLLNKKIGDARIIAPAGGVISEKYYETGEAIPPLSPIVEIIQIDEVWVKIYISETQLPEIRQGQSATVAVDGSEQSLNGTVAWISPQAEFTPKNILTPETRTSLVYAVKILVKNPDGVLKHGMPVEVRLQG